MTTTSETHAHVGQGNPLAPAPQDEQLPVGQLALVAIVSAVIFAVGILWAYEILRDEEHNVQAATGESLVGAKIGQAEIGIVDQRPFEEEDRERQLRNQKQKELSTYGWSNREQNLAHIPIEKAMEMVADKRALPDVAGGAQTPQGMSPNDRGEAPGGPAQGGAVPSGGAPPTVPPTGSAMPRTTPVGQQSQNPTPANP